MRSKLALFIGVAVMLSGVLGGARPTPASAQDTITQFVQLTNSGFEEPAGEDGAIPGWTPNYVPGPGKVSHQISGAQAHGGSQSLNLFDNATDKMAELVSDQTPIQPGTKYRASVWINPNQPEGYTSGSVGGSMHLRFYDANHNAISVGSNAVHYRETSAQGKFTQIQVEVEAPQNAAYAAVALLITAAWTGNTYFDDVQLSCEKEAPPSIPAAGTIPLINPGFEDQAEEDGSIPGWNPAYTPSDNVSHQVSGVQVKSGNNALRIKDYSPNEFVEIESDRYEAYPGKWYKVHAFVSPNDPAIAISGSRGGSIYLYFYDANGQRLSTAAKNRADYSTLNNFGVYVPLNLELEAPEGTKYVSIAASVTKAWVGDTYFDDFSLTFRSDAEEENEEPEDLGERVIASDGLIETVSIPVPNAGFERNLMTDGTIQGWSAWSPSAEGAKFERSAEKAFSGTYSLKITDQDSERDVVLMSAPLAVKPGTVYTTSAMMYVEDAPLNGATLLMRFYNEQDKQVGEVLEHYKSPMKEWYKASVQGLAPAEAKHARVFALVNKYSQAAAYYDDFLFTYNRELMNLAIAAPKYAVANSSVTVQLGASNAAGLGAAKLLLAYDREALEYAGTTVHADFGTGDTAQATAADNDGLLTIEASKANGETVSGDVGIVNVNFKVKGKAGLATAVLKAGSVLIKRVDGTEEAKTFQQDKKVRMTLQKDAEDVNHDGVVNLVDLLLAAKQAGAPLTEANQHYDLNGDGMIDIADVGLLAQAIADMVQQAE